MTRYFGGVGGPVSSGNAGAQLSPRKGLPGERRDRGRPSSGYAHLQTALPTWTGAALGDGFQGCLGKPCRMGRSCAA